MSYGGLESPVRISWLALKVVVHSVMSNSVTPRIAACHTRLSYPSLSPEICSISCLLSQWWHPTTSSSVSPSPPALSLSQHVFSHESALHIRWRKHWRFSISPSSEYPGLISFRIDSFDLLALQGTLKSLLQDRSSKASVLPCSAIFMVQLSHPCMTSGKTIALTIWTSLNLFLGGTADWEGRGGGGPCFPQDWLAFQRRMTWGQERQQLL